MLGDGISIDEELQDAQTSEKAMRAAAAAGYSTKPTQADWEALARQLPLLKRVLQGLPLGHSGQRRQLRLSLVGSILNRRPMWDGSCIVEKFRDSVEAYDGVKQSDPAKVEELLGEIRGAVEAFERGPCLAFSDADLSKVCKKLRRAGYDKAGDSLEVFRDARAGERPLGVMDPDDGRDIGEAMARAFPNRNKRALFNTCLKHLGTHEHPFARALLDGWGSVRRERRVLVSVVYGGKDGDGPGRPWESNGIATLNELQPPFYYDRRSQEIVIVGSMPWELDNPGARRAFDDSDASLWAHYIAQQYQLDLSARVWTTVINAYAQRHNSYDPVQDYLDRLPAWDGVMRWPTILTELMGQPADIYQPVHHTCMVRWGIGAVARAYKPGCKMDTMIVLIGDQGTRKTSFARALVPQEAMFLEGFVGKGTDRDTLAKLHGPWIVEHGELAGLKHGDVENVKNLLSTRVDKYRLPYAKTGIRVPRSHVNIGTANDRGSGLFRDPTGSRRFWPVPIAKDIPTHAIEENRDQLWAEVKQYYRDGFEWWLDRSEADEIAQSAAQYTFTDDLQDDIAEHITKGELDFITTSEALAIAGYVTPYNRRDAMRVAEILKGLGGHNERRSGRRGFAFPHGIRHRY